MVAIKGGALSPFSFDRCSKTLIVSNVRIKMRANGLQTGVMRRTPKCSLLFFPLHHSFPSFCIIYFLSCLPPGVAAVPFLHRLLLCKINFPPPDSPAKCFISLMFCLALFFPQLLQLSPRRFPPMARLQHPLPPTFLHVVLPSGRAPWCRPYSIYIYIYIFFLGCFFFPFMWGKIDFVDVEVSNGAECCPFPLTLDEFCMFLKGFHSSLLVLQELGEIHQ